jgi:hypothetical protein
MGSDGVKFENLPKTIPKYYSLAFLVSFYGSEYFFAVTIEVSIC